MKGKRGKGYKERQRGRGERAEVKSDERWKEWRQKEREREMWRLGGARHGEEERGS